MSYTLGEAAKATGKAKSTILRAIKKGRISAIKEDGSYSIDPSELFRVFDATVADHYQPNDLHPQEEPSETLRLRLALVEKEREREREQLQATIDDLRIRLDRSEDRITAILSDQRRQEPRRQWWRLKNR